MPTSIDKERKKKQLRATYVCTFVYADEPQVILLERGKDAKVIAVAIDRGGMEYPFLGAEISFSQLERYQREFVDLRYLFTMPYYHRWYLFDLATLDKDKSLLLSDAEKEDYQKEEYLPEHQFFARNHTEPEELPVLATAGKQKHLLDGNWEASDYARFFAQVSSLYSFYMGLKKLKSSATSAIQTVGLRKAFTEYPFRGGSSYVNFYKDLRDSLGFHERLAMGGIRKESPGYVNMTGDAAVLGQVVDAMKHFEAGYEALQPRYNFLHDYLSKLDFLATSPDSLKIHSATASSIEGHARELAEGLGISYDEIASLTGNPLSTAKIVLSHYRRLERYYLFFAEGRTHLPSDQDA
jgi:hypothetical protein